MSEETTIITDLIKAVRKQVIVLVVGGILSAFTINLIFIFSINDTIEELREYKKDSAKAIEKMQNELIEFYKNN